LDKPPGKEPPEKEQTASSTLQDEAGDKLEERELTPGLTDIQNTE